MVWVRVHERENDGQKKVRKEICMSSSNRLVLGTDGHTRKLQCSRCCTLLVQKVSDCISAGVVTMNTTFVRRVDKDFPLTSQKSGKSSVLKVRLLFKQNTDLYHLSLKVYHI